MPVFAAATDQGEIELPEPGRYIVTCVAIEDAPDKGFGPGVKWVFQLTDAQTGVTLQSSKGGNLELWQFTSVKMGPKAKARPIIEALLGRPLELREVPDPRKLLNRSMLAMLIHEQKDDGTDRAVLTMHRPYTQEGAVAAPSAAPAGSPRPSPRLVNNPNGSGPGLLAQVQQAIRKAEILQTPNHLEWIGLQPEGMTDGDLYSVLQEINADIQAA